MICQITTPNKLGFPVSYQMNARFAHPEHEQLFLTKITVKDQSTAIYLNVRPYHSALIEDIAMEFGLQVPDFRAALGDFYSSTAQSYGQQLGR